MPAFLMIATIITGIAFANEGGHKYVEAHGIKESVKYVATISKPVYKVNE